MFFDHPQKRYDALIERREIVALKAITASNRLAAWWHDRQDASLCRRIRDMEDEYDLDRPPKRR